MENVGPILLGWEHIYGLCPGVWDEGCKEVVSLNFRQSWLYSQLGVEVGARVTKPGQLEHYLLRSYVGLEDKGLELLTTILPPYNADNVATVEEAEPRDVLTPGLDSMVGTAGSSHTWTQTLLKLHINWVSWFFHLDQFRYVLYFSWSKESYKW